MQTTPPTGLSVVVAVYNGQLLVDPLVEALVEVLDRTGEPYEVLLVDDGSLDMSWETITSAASKNSHVKGYRLSRNFGQQIAVSAGIAQARHAFVIVMDCDLQNPPAAIIDILAALKAGNEIVYTVSKTRNNVRDALTSRLFWFLLTRVFKVRMVKNQLMMRGMTYRFARIYDSYPEITRTVAGIVADIGLKHAVIEVENAKRTVGKSGYNFLKRFDLMIHMIISITTVPLSILIYISLAVLGATFLGGTYYFVMALFFSVPSGFTTIILTSFFFGSLITLILGILGIYLANIYAEVRRRPLFVIAEETNSDG